MSVFGRPLKINASGWLARIFQHEIDHLEGICYIDRATEIFKPSEETDQESEENAESQEADLAAPAAAAGESQDTEA